MYRKFDVNVTVERDQPIIKLSHLRIRIPMASPLNQAKSRDTCAINRKDKRLSPTESTNARWNHVTRTNIFARSFGQYARYAIVSG